MPIENRKVTCDICSCEEIEMRFGDGWVGWSIIHGVGAREPEGDVPLEMVNLETHLCPRHTQILARFITELQNENDRGD